jgi:predicted flap endonuclease-1-like 5' DNA nuclease
MTYVPLNYWGWFLTAYVIGIAIGYFTWSHERRTAYFSGWLRWWSIAFVIALIVAILKLLPGRAGLYLEIAVWFFPLYILGCFIGGWLRANFAPGEPVSITTRHVLIDTLPDREPPVAAQVAPFVSAEPSVGTDAPALQPKGLSVRPEDADDLKWIRGVGPRNEAMLHELGIWRFAQIADWSPENAEWISRHINFPGRIAREDWIGQARLLAGGKRTAYANFVAGGKIRPSADADDPLSDNDIAVVRGDIAAGGVAPVEVATQAGAQARNAGEAAATDVAAGHENGNALMGESASAAATAEERPAAVAPPLSGKGDDLKLIKGIGPKNEKICNDLGVFHFAQIADWTPENARWFGAHMKFPGRIEREQWIPQAKLLAYGIDTEHSAAVKSGAFVMDEKADEPLSEAEVAQLSILLPTNVDEAIAKVAESHRPAALPSPDGVADDLKLIKGIGPKNEKICNDLGVFHFSQMADWSPDNAKWMGRHMKFPGRIEREQWIAQAKLLAAGIDTPHSLAVKAGALKIDESADAPLSDDDAQALASALPQEMPAVEGEDSHEGRRPLGLADARGGTPDDLKRIKGIGKQNEARLHALGVWHFEQIAAWSQENVKWVGSYLAFPGRITREDWINQAKQLAAGGETEFSQRVAAGKVATSKDDGTLGQNNVADLTKH